MTNIIEKAESVILSCRTRAQLQAARTYGNLAVKASGCQAYQAVLDAAADLAEIQLVDRPVFSFVPYHKVGAQQC